MRSHVSVVIPTFNVARQIHPTLESVAWADEIIIVDMHSSDETRAVCEKYKNVKFFMRSDYIYGNVNFGFDQAASDWVIRIDSDEVLNPELQASIQRFVGQAAPDVVGCIFPSVQYMFGRPMRYGPGLGGPPRRCMFRRGAARYQVQAEHEDFTVSQPDRWVTLEGFYEHFTNATVREAITKYVYYAEKDAARSNQSGESLTHPARVLWRGLRLFWHMFWKQKGYKDGRFGFYSSLFRGAIQYWITEAELWHRFSRKEKN